MALFMLLAFVAGAFTATKCIAIGLKWQIETGKGKTPEIEIPVASSVERYFERKEVKNLNNETSKIIDEYLNGPAGDNNVY